MSELKSSKYTMSDIRDWAEEYKECQSFTKVGEKFGVCRKAVSRLVQQHKESLDVKIRHEFYGISTDTTKVCTRCETEKSKDEFYIHSKKTGVLSAICKICSKYDSKEWKDGNREKYLYNKRSEYKRNKERHNAYSKEYSIKHSAIISKKGRERYLRTRDDRREIRKVYDSEYSKRPHVRLANNLRTRIRSALFGNKKIGSAVKDLGCTIGDLMERFESLFEPGMTWDNYGLYGWHIDHIKPLSKFDLTNREQFLEACHYTNLQPLWAKDNLSKGAKISEEYGNV